MIGTKRGIKIAPGYYFQIKCFAAPPDHARARELGRQAARVESALDSLDATVQKSDLELTDGIIRLACLLEWGVFRNRFSLDSRPGLQKVIEFANQDSVFQSTAIPA